MNIEDLKKILRLWIEDGFVEGELSVEPEYYILWRPEELEEFNRDYQLSEYAPGFITFGGNGGGELFVVNESGEVFYIPAIGMAPDTAIKISDNLQQFRSCMRK
ncbi:SMI1/KNR4 family protein [Pseudoalteromonas sp. SG44-17]|uniref:SMI1/KNR4 family protein n=1 Tax=Pseudoalteromonas sp. SG44-17 TaxID=2760963 RepID=UPI00217571E5|nr:SMI1/KNR4 family protein [Pseudoalteromonas sp. SG44-17]